MEPVPTQTRSALRPARRPTAPVRASTFRRCLMLCALTLLSLAALASAALAAPVGLGTSGSFSVLGGSAVTNTGPSVLAGDLGVAPAAAISGFPPGLAGGAVHANDAVAQQAKSDLVTAFDDAAGRSSTATVSGDLAGRTLTAGVYTSASTLGLSGDLILDAQGDADAVFVFQAGSSLTTASGSRVLLIGGAQACNVFWKVGSSATIGTASAFTGTILALTSISVTTAARVDGRALARNGAVTLDTNVFTSSACTRTTEGTGGGTGSGGTGGTGGTTGGTGTGTGGTTGGTGTGTGGRGTGGRGTGTGGAGGRSRGPGGSRSRSPLATTVLTRPSGQTGCDSALLVGRVRPGAVASRWFFQFGTSRRYGRQTTVGHLRSGSRGVAVNARARGLQPSTRYHYRLVSVRPGGQRTHGGDRSFNTNELRACRTPALARPPSAPPAFTG